MNGVPRDAPPARPPLGSKGEREKWNFLQGRSRKKGGGGQGKRSSKTVKEAINALRCTRNQVGGRKGEDSCRRLKILSRRKGVETAGVRLFKTLACDKNERRKTESEATWGCERGGERTVGSYFRKKVPAEAENEGFTVKYNFSGNKKVLSGLELTSH